MKGVKKEGSILLIGSYGRGNIGDDAFLLAALRLFRSHNIFINSADDNLLPAEAKQRVSTIATTGLRDIHKKLRVFASIRHIVYCGGDLWVDLMGDRFPRQSLYKMLAVNMVAKIFGKKIHYLGCGVGDIHGYSLFLAQASARLASSIAVREERSAQLLGLSKIKVLPDLTINLKESRLRKRLRRKSEKFTIGISILYYLPQPERNFPHLLSYFKQLIDSLPVKKFKIVLFPMLASEQIKHDDVWASKQLEKLLPNHELTIFTSTGVKEYVQAVADIDLLIGTRLHANILATLCGTPCLGIAYRPKVAEFFHMNNLDEYCLRLDQLDRLEEAFNRMYNDSEVRHRFLQASKRNKRMRRAYQELIKEHF